MLVQLESRDTPGSMLDTLLADALRMAPLAAPVAEPQFHPLTSAPVRPPAFAEDFFADPFSPRGAPPSQTQPAQPTSGQGEETSTRRKSILDDVLLDELASASSAPVRLSFASTLEPPRGGPSINEPALFTPATRSGAATPASGMSDTAEVSGPRDVFASLSVAAMGADGGTAPPKGPGSPMVVELPLVSVSAYDPVAAELRSPPGTTTGVFEFDRTGDTAADLTVKFRVDGTATPDADYTGLGQLTTETINGETVLTGTAVIPAGESWARVMITAVDDTLVEGDEDAQLTVLGTAEYNPDPDRSEATVTIADNDPMDDPAQQVWVGRVDKTAQKDYENPTNPQNIGKVELRRSVASGMLSVNYSVSGTAALNTDYSLWGPVASGYYNQITDTKLGSSGKVTFADGQDRLWVRVVPVGSGGPADLTADLTVTAGAGYTVADPHEGDVGVYGDRAPGWAVQPNPNGGYGGDLLDVWVTTGQEHTYAGYSPYSGDAAATEAGQDPGAILVTYQYQSDDPGFVPPDQPGPAWVLGGTAEEGVDYTVSVTRVVSARTDESIYFPSTGKTVYRISSVDRIDITPIDDGEWEGDETVDVAVGRATTDGGGVIGDAQVTIADDAVASLPVVSVEAPDGVSTEWGPSTGSYRITRADSKLGFPLTVSYEFGGTATYGADYTVTGKDSKTNQQVTLPQTGTVTFPAGVQMVELKLTPADDSEAEGPEPATLTVLEPPGSQYKALTPPSADVYIRDDDATASVGDFVWSDLDGKGTQDPGEPGIGNVQVRLYAGDPTTGGTLIDTTTTNSAGRYKFGLLNPGSYYLGFEVVGKASPADAGSDLSDSDVTTVGTDGFGYTAAFPLAAGEEKDTVDAGMALPVVTVTASKPNTQEPAPLVVGESGEFTFTRAGGDMTKPLLVRYAVSGTADKTDYKESLYGEITIPANAASVAQTVSPVLDKKAEGAETVIVTITAADKEYTVGDPKTATVTIQDYSKSGISDFVWDDLNRNGLQDFGEPGIKDVTVKLFKAGVADPVAQAKTGVDGKYTFGPALGSAGIDPGKYTVQFVLPTGYAFTAKGASANRAIDSDANPADGKTAEITVVAGEENDTIDAGMVQLGTNGVMIGPGVVPGNSSYNYSVRLAGNLDGANFRIDGTVLDPAGAALGTVVGITAALPVFDPGSTTTLFVLTGTFKNDKPAKVRFDFVEKATNQVKASKEVVVVQVIVDPAHNGQPGSIKYPDTASSVFTVTSEGGNGGVPGVRFEATVTLKGPGANNEGVDKIKAGFVQFVTTNARRVQYGPSGVNRWLVAPTQGMGKLLDANVNARPWYSPQQTAIFDTAAPGPNPSTKTIKTNDSPAMRNIPLTWQSGVAAEINAAYPNVDFVKKLYWDQSFNTFVGVQTKDPDGGANLATWGEAQLNWTLKGTRAVARVDPVLNMDKSIKEYAITWENPNPAEIKIVSPTWAAITAPVVMDTGLPISNAVNADGRYRSTLPQP